MKKTISLFRRALFIIPLLAFFTNALAQNLPGKRDSLYSDILKEERVIQVLLPENYKPGSEEKYEVLYLLDGDSNLKSIAAIQQFAQSESYMPPIIIVAVFNTNRDRDFLPTNVAGNAASGGADKFLSFFKSELIPYINKSYPTNGSNILFGHSFGGVFSMYALLTEPQLFNSYLAVDPSFWWDGNYMNKLAADKLSVSLQSGKSLFITGREGDGLKQMGIPIMDSVLKSKAPKDLNWKIAAYPDETHGSVRLKSVYDGLKFFYDGYSNRGVEFHPMNGIVLKDKPYTVYFFGAPKSARYTTDGSEPTTASKILEPENSLMNSVKLSARALGRNDRYNKSTVGEFKIGKTLPANEKPKNAQSGGFHYSYYEGEWDTLPDFSKLKPIQSGIANKDFDINKLSRQVNFACVIEGHIEIQKDGYYIFVLDSDDGSKLFLDDKLLIAYDGLHGGGSPKTYLVPLEKGFYPIRMEHFQKGGGVLLKLEYVVPGEEKPRPIPVPFEVQYSSLK
ncbi:alpha/beta hydrolase-fold protein [Pseudoduganella namucuonensis]|uniref:Predicted hydrolase of the alpha/beta superfamily n=1 Tax=Pseudoduganella namucuonensis TaxID=1035707 RepID=A0A1I7KSJ4_9BURK|nr:alpha/beta hydrolase-fold protein [Pseudoduganella namucuonensis]SFV00400.1 Predicted hydrolase of the alpha/beta superfamily [Pseudoduganella namucuonensis]